MKMAEMFENTVGSGEIARSEQFLLVPQCFQNDLHCRHLKGWVYVGKGIFAKGSVRSKIVAIVAKMMFRER